MKTFFILPFLIVSFSSSGQVPIRSMEDTRIDAVRIIRTDGDIEMMSEHDSVIVRVHTLLDTATKIYFRNYKRYQDSSGVFVMDMLFNNFKKIYKNIELTLAFNKPVISVFWGAPSGKMDIEEATSNETRTEWKLKAPAISSPVGLRAIVRSEQPVTVDIYWARGINIFAD